ncbi:MAG TPA: alpha/beta fold hydrolase [Dermatophilaceae bacterium]|nr:alpha/beta fold hydrolase [Dermatophilaceae bacterium]
MRSAAALQASQRVRFCRSADGTRIAYAVHGTGQPLLLDACWLSHLEYDWQSPVWRHYLVELGRVATVVRFDERGHGMSDRDATDFSLERRIEDLEAVADHAGLDRFAIMAMAQGGPVALHYTHRHPDRVTRLVCASTYAAPSQHVTDDDRALEDAFQAMIRAGWDRKDPLFRRVFTSMMIPDAAEEQMAWLDELHQRSASARTAYASRVERGKADATGVLAHLTVPTLVIHSRHERMNDFEHGRALAAAIKDSRLVPLDSRNHILLESEPAWPVFVREVAAFLAEDAAGSGGLARAVTPLTSRELDVLRLVAQGRDNAAVAADLFLSVRTVERHLQRIYAKLGLSGPSARAGAVAHVLASAPIAR